MSFAHGETVTVLRPGSTTDRYGNVVPDWSAPTEVDLPGCAIVPRHDGENRDAGRQGVVVGYTVHAPAGSDVRPSDRVRFRGEEFEVEGEAALWSSPFTGWGAGVEFAVRRVEG